jgi:hypothetical protein
VVNDTEVETVIPESRDVRDPPEQHVDEEIALVQNILPDEELGTHLTKEGDADAIVTEYHDAGVIDDDKLLSTEQEIAVVDRLVEAVADEIDQIEPRAESISQTEERAPANMDIGELVERAIEESRYEADEEKYDEIEIIEEDDYEMKTLDGDESDAEIADWQGEVWDQDDIDEEDDLAA